MILRFVKSIRFQLLGIMLLCYLIPTVVLGVYMGAIFFDDLQAKTETALFSSVEHCCTQTVQKVDQTISLAKDATYDGELTQVYADYHAGNLSNPEFLRLSRSYIERKYDREELFDFALYYPVAYPSLLCYNRTGYDSTMQYMRSDHSQILSMAETLDTRCLLWESDDRLYLVRNLMNLRMERYGILVLGLNHELLLGPLEDLARSWNAEWSILLGEIGADALDWSALPEGLSEIPQKRSVSYVRQLEKRDYNFCLRLILSRTSLYGELYAFRRLMALLLLLLVPVITALLVFVHRRLIKPISLLSRASRRIEAGELGVTVPMCGGDELGDLGRAFSNMSRRIALLIDKTYKEEIALRDARIQAMQSRINPHFINNALETLNWEARMEGSDTMVEMVESLSVLLNAGMSRGDRRIVPLKESLEVAAAYFYFIGLRFGDRLHTGCQVQEGLEEFQIPLLVIQPLLENAVEHGIAPAGGGSIWLDCRRMDDRLRIRVTNSGKGLSAEDKARLSASLQGDSQGGAHLGLANIASRLHLIYGDDATFDVFSDLEGHTVAQVELPLSVASLQGGDFSR